MRFPTGAHWPWCAREARPGFWTNHDGFEIVYSVRLSPSGIMFGIAYVALMTPPGIAYRLTSLTGDTRRAALRRRTRAYAGRCMQRLHIVASCGRSLAHKLPSFIYVGPSVPVTACPVVSSHRAAAHTTPLPTGARAAVRKSLLPASSFEA